MVLLDDMKHHETTIAKNTRVVKLFLTIWRAEFSLTCEIRNFWGLIGTASNISIPRHLLTLAI